MNAKLKGLHLHFDPLSGIAGDMTVAALVHAGVPRSVVTEAVEAMGVKGLRVGFEKRKRGAFVGMGFTVSWPGKRRAAPARPTPAHEHAHTHAHTHDHDHDHDHDHTHAHAHAHAHAHEHEHEHEHAHDHRDYAEIQRLLKKASFSPAIRALATDIFSRIAEAEAALHGVSVARVAFHEVGAFDSIADIVGAAAALVWLDPSGVTATPPVLGTGSVSTAHGKVAVPAPATAALLRGLPVRAEGTGELTTPTGAAILASVVREFRDMPPVRLAAQGFGAGTRELADRPNVLRVMLGEPVGKALPPSATQVVLLQANLDDMSPQLVEPLMTGLFAAGALDVWVTSILMKKGRPALEVSALAPPAGVSAVARAFFDGSPTLGVRQVALDRSVLSRSVAEVQTVYGRVPVKVAALDGEVLGAAPEFEDCRRLAARAKVPVRRVLAAAAAAAADLERARRGGR
jgi:hypothetical protein